MFSPTIQINNYTHTCVNVVNVVINACVRRARDQGSHLHTPLARAEGGAGSSGGGSVRMCTHSGIRTSTRAKWIASAPQRQPGRTIHRAKEIKRPRRQGHWLGGGPGRRIWIRHFRHERFLIRVGDFPSGIPQRPVLFHLTVAIYRTLRAHGSCAHGVAGAAPVPAPDRQVAAARGGGGARPLRPARRQA